MGPELAWEIVRSVNTPPKVLAQLTEIYAHDVRLLEKIATHQNTSAETLNFLAKEVPWAVAVNRNASASLLRYLSNHPNSYVYDAVLYNPSAPKDVIERLNELKDTRPKAATPREVLELYSKGSKYFDDFLLRNMERTDLIPAEAALALAQHPNPDIRQTLLQHSEKIAMSVRPQIVSQLQGKTP